MKKVIIFLFFAISIFSMDRYKYENVISLIQSKNYSEAFSELSEMRNTYSNDPEYYALIINYYFSKSMSDGIVLRKGEPSQDEYLTLYDSTNTNPVGVVEGQTTYNLDTLNVGLKEFEVGLEKFQNRLDLHLGLIHTLLVTEQYTRLQDRLLSVLNISREIKNNWLWSFNEPYSENSQEEFLGAIQDNLYQLFQKENSEADSVLVTTSKSLINYYPNCIFGYNNLGAVYSVSKRYDLAKEYFEKALKIDETDIMVLANLGNICVNNNQKEDAIKYYKMIVNIADEETVNWAKKQIELLSK